ncbi:unnamed protein product, partial [marine sediment metagenome]
GEYDNATINNTMMEITIKGSINANAFRLCIVRIFLIVFKSSHPLGP